MRRTFAARTPGRLVAVLGLVAGMVALSASSASAGSPCDGPNPPASCGGGDGDAVVGRLERVAQTPGGLHVRGWAAREESDERLTVRIAISGYGAAGDVPADGARGDTHDGHGFDATLPVHPGTGVCASIPGTGVSLGCAQLTLGSDPVGVFVRADRAGNHARVQGWALDPDTAAPVEVRFTAGLRPRASALANRTGSGWGPRYEGYGLEHGFDALVPVGPDDREVCVEAVNLGAGADRGLGCAPLAPAAPAGLTVRSASRDDVAVSWLAPVGADGYRYQVRSGTGDWSPPVPVHDPNASLGHVETRIAVDGPGWYCVRVVAFNAVGDSDPAESCGAALEASDVEHGDLSVLELNLRGLHEYWGGAETPEDHTAYIPWQDRYDRVAQWMQASHTQPDVMALQEVHLKIFGTVGDIVHDYEPLFVLISRIRAHTGADYRIAYANASCGNRGPFVVECGGDAVIYNTARLVNSTANPTGERVVGGGERPGPGVYPRESFPCIQPSAAFAGQCSLLDGKGLYWSSIYRKATGDLADGPGFVTFARRGGPAGRIGIYNAHVLTWPDPEVAPAYTALTDLVDQMEHHRMVGTRRYPPIILGDFNTGITDMRNNTTPGGSLADFDIAGYDNNDVVGVLGGEWRTFPADFAAAPEVKILPTEHPATGNCGSNDVLWSDHCAVFVRFRPRDTTARLKLYAATHTDRLLTRDLNVIEPAWQDIGHARHIAAMTAHRGRLYAATSDNQLWARDPEILGADWQLLGPADNVIALAADNGTLFAATRDNELWARDAVDDAQWQPIGHANDVVAMTALHGKLYAATRDNTLWIRDPVLHDVNWQRIGHANDVIAMAAAGDQLYAVSRDHTLWQRDPLPQNINWRAIGTAADVAGLAAQ
jgi:hypothetical protein